MPSLAPQLSFTPQQTQAAETRQLQTHRLTQYQREGLAILQKPALELREEVKTALLNNPVLREVSSGVVTLDELPRDPERFQRRERDADADGKSYAEDTLRDVVENQAAFDSARRLGSGVTPEDPEARERWDYRMNSLTEESSLYALLLEAVHADVVAPPQVLRVCEVLVGEVNGDGFLEGTDEELMQIARCDVEVLHAAIDVLQSQLSPAGLCARNLQECLLLQVRREHPDETVARRILEQNLLEALAAKRFDDVADAVDCELWQVEDALAFISRELDPHPGWQLRPPASAPSVVADIIMQPLAGGWRVYCNRQLVTEVEINPDYLEMSERKDLDKEAHAYLDENIQSAQRLVQHLNARHDALERLGGFLLREQPRVFEKRSLVELKPMTQAQCAEALDVATSTVCRLVNGKYVSVPGMGAVELRDFFTGGFRTEDGEMVSSGKVAQRLKAIFEEEDRQNPLSDDEVARRLKAEGFIISRRTVTKYRLRENIPSSFHRRK